MSGTVLGIGWYSAQKLDKGPAGETDDKQTRYTGMVIRATKNVKLDNGMESEGQGFLRLGRKASAELTMCVECWQRLGEGPPGLGNRWSKGLRGKKLSISERAETGQAWLEQGEGPGAGAKKGNIL